MKQILSTLTCAILLTMGNLYGQTKVVTGTTGTATWSKDTTYILDGYVRVDNGDSLTIEAGTIIKAETGSGSDASAFIVERNGYIDAQGTAAEPIIFTSIDDDVTDPNDLLDKEALGLWGGVIICGDASTNTANNGSEQVEGIPATLPATVGTYGGSTDDDNSGILRYVSIRHTGTALASNNEIQGLTLAGVGSGTTIEFVESYASADDGIEIFGGTVNLKNVSIAFATDDALDYDQGWRGNIQWAFIIQSAGFGDRTGEWDGADSPENGMPFGVPTLANVTIIGNLPAGTNNRLLTFRANGGGKVYNSIFTEQGRGIDIQYKSDANVDESSYDRFVAGELDLSNNVFWNVAGNDAAELFKISPIAGGWTDSATQVNEAIAAVQAKLPGQNSIVDPGISGLSYTDDGGLDPRFTGNSAYTNVANLGGFFASTSYKGAFGPASSDLWIKGWTAIDHYGYIISSPADITPTAEEVIVAGTTGDAVWTSDKTYILQGYVRVDNGDTLRIEAGTVIKAAEGTGSAASALIVERDGYIDAQGTADNPIIFTSILDEDVTDPDDLLDKEALGLWGGIIVCGDASTNTASNGSEQVEGIPATLPATVGTFGGNEDDDNSGILRYVSIRHTGVALASNNEIQGLTLAGVGSGTTIEFVESYASADDGIEIFGGTVNLKNISIAFAEDDALDYDQGWRGNAQWVFIIQSAGFGDRTGEWDGADSPENGTPFGIPTLANVTVIGNLPAGTNNRLITFRANGGGKVYNSIFTEQGRGVDIQYKSDANVDESSYDRFVAGELDLSNNVFWNVAGNDAAELFKISPIAGGWTDSTAQVDAAIAAVQAKLPSQNSIADPGISGLTYADDGILDPRFTNNIAYTNVANLGGFFANTSYKGAFGPAATDLWIKGWTAIDHYGYVTESPADITPTAEEVIVSGTTGDDVWTSDKTYILQGYVRVDNGDTLRIEAGTVIKAAEGTGANASALIVERDGYIDAQGTADNPIIFTSVLDDVTDPDDLLDKETLGLWGGIIVCGDASTNTANNGTEQVEGIPATLPATVGTFGGSTDDDNSGILRYVSIRHTGVALASNNEIQGLTLAGVGSGTTIEFVESYASADDGIEIFGGTVNLKNVSIAFAEDDALDYDQGWRGNAQWVFIIQSAGFGDRTGEWDGADSPENGTPFGTPTIANLTIIGNQPAGTNNRLITFRANGGGKVYNSVFTEQGRGIDIQYKADANVDESSYDRFVAGDLALSNNVFWNVAGNDAAELFKISPIAGGWTDSTAQVDAAIADIQGTLPAANTIADPGIAGLSYSDDGGLDPRFSKAPVISDFFTINDPFFASTTYKGAFGLGADDLWIKNWTALDHYGYLVSDPGTITSLQAEIDEKVGFIVYPNPVRDIMTIEFNVKTADRTSLQIFDLAGSVVASVHDISRRDNNKVVVDTESFAPGMYIVRARTAAGMFTKKVVVQ